MSFSFSMGYRSPLNSSIFNEKLHEVWGRNGVLSGFELSKYTNNQLKVSSGEAIIRGVRVTYNEDNAGNPLKVTIPLTNNGNVFIYGLYNHKLSSFTLHTTDSIYNAQGEWKVFLGHTKITGGAITEVQPIVEPSITDVEYIYRRMPNMNELINFFYESTNQIGDQIDVILNDRIGNMSSLKTEHKSSIVGSINELVDTKEPTLTRDRVLGLLGGGENGGNIDIGSINNIPIKNFVLKDRAIRTPENSGLKGGGDLSADRTLQINWGDTENQVPRGNHNHSGFHLNKKFSSNFGTNASAAVYSQLSYFAQNTVFTGAIKITLPKGFTNANIAIDIKGFDGAVNTTAYTLQLGGYAKKTTASWKNCTADILGKSPFSKVKFGKDSSNKACIILGDSSTKWVTPSLLIDQVLVSGEDSADWSSGWSITAISSETGLIVDEIPKITTGGPQKGEFVEPARSISAGLGLTGGGSLAGDITISANFGTGENNVARGNHGHDDYLKKKMPSRNGILVTDGSGVIKVDPIVWDYELQRLQGVTGNIQEQLNSKSNSNHGHSNYVPITGTTMNGSLTFGDNVNHKLSAHFLYIRGNRLTIGGGEPSIKERGTVWIDLPF